MAVDPPRACRRTSLSPALLSRQGAEEEGCRGGAKVTSKRASKGRARDNLKCRKDGGPVAASEGPVASKGPKDPSESSIVMAEGGLLFFRSPLMSHSFFLNLS